MYLAIAFKFANYANLVKFPDLAKPLCQNNFVRTNNLTKFANNINEY